MSDRDRFVELVKQSQNKCHGQECEMCKYQPSSSCYWKLVADHLIANGVAVPVRCKECTHCMMCYPYKEVGKDAVPAWYCNLHRFYVKADDYCSYGKRKENGDE